MPEGRCIPTSLSFGCWRSFQVHWPWASSIGPVRHTSTSGHLRPSPAVPSPAFWRSSSDCIGIRNVKLLMSMIGYLASQMEVDRCGCAVGDHRFRSHRVSSQGSRGRIHSVRDSIERLGVRIDHVGESSPDRISKMAKSNCNQCGGQPFNAVDRIRVGRGLDRHARSLGKRICIGFVGPVSELVAVDCIGEFGIIHCGIDDQSACDAHCIGRYQWLGRDMARYAFAHQCVTRRCQRSWGVGLELGMASVAAASKRWILLGLGAIGLGASFVMSAREKLSTLASQGGNDDLSERRVVRWSGRFDSLSHSSALTGIGACYSVLSFVLAFGWGGRANRFSRLFRARPSLVFSRWPCQLQACEWDKSASHWSEVWPG